MALTVENGTGLSNADSYVTRSIFIAWAKSRGKVIPSTDEADVFLRRGFDYLNAKETCFQGERLTKVQSGAFPRTGVVIHCETVEDDELPSVLLNAQMELALAVSNGVALFPAGNDQLVVFEKVGPIATSYSEKFGNTTPVHVPAAEYLIDLLCGGPSVFSLMTQRV